MTSDVKAFFYTRLVPAGFFFFLFFSPSSVNLRNCCAVGRWHESSPSLSSDTPGVSTASTCLDAQSSCHVIGPLENCVDSQSSFAPNEVAPCGVLQHCGVPAGASVQWRTAALMPWKSFWTGRQGSWEKLSFLIHLLVAHVASHFSCFPSFFFAPSRDSSLPPQAVRINRHFYPLGGGNISSSRRLNWR